MQRNSDCPVCGMSVSGEPYAIDYLGMHFVFCSRQCEQRFSANPHLYIGRPGQPAPAQQGRVLRKRRHLYLDAPLTLEQQALLRDALYAMMGVHEVETGASGKELLVTYDLMQATAAQIEQELERAGARLGHGWDKRLRRAFVHYLEDTEVENLEVRPDPRGHGQH